MKKKLTVPSDDFSSHLFENIERWKESLKREDISPEDKKLLTSLIATSKKGIESFKKLKDAVISFNGDEEIKA